jgi:hypothetical protein
MIRNRCSLQLGHNASKISIIFASPQQIFPLCSAYTTRNCYIIVKKELFSSKNVVVPTHVYTTAWEGEKGMIYRELYMFHTALSMQWLRYGMDNLRIVGKFLAIERYSSLKVSRPALRPTQPPSQQIQEPLSPGVTQLGHEADHSLPFSTQNWWSCTSIPPYTFMAWCVI